MRLIDADMIKGAMRQVIMEKRGDCDMQFLNNICYLLDGCPTVDAVPVVHGRWNESNYGGEIYNNCTNCAYLADYRTPYCPNCGARMDGDGDDE